MCSHLWTCHATISCLHYSCLLWSRTSSTTIRHLSDLLIHWQFTCMYPDHRNKSNFYQATFRSHYSIIISRLTLLMCALIANKFNYYPGSFRSRHAITTTWPILSRDGRVRHGFFASSLERKRDKYSLAQSAPSDLTMRLLCELLLFLAFSQFSYLFLNTFIFKFISDEMDLAARLLSICASFQQRELDHNNVQLFSNWKYNFILYLFSIHSFLISTCASFQQWENVIYRASF